MFGLTKKNRIARNLGSHLRIMSLIPSESYSFPDHFTKTVTPSRKPKNEERQVAPVETRRKRPSIVPLPRPQTQPVPAHREAVPNPALRRASAPPPRIPEAPVKKIPLPPSFKPKMRWNNRAPAMESAPLADNGAEQLPHTPPAQNAIPMNPASPAGPRRVMPSPEIAMAQNFFRAAPAEPISAAKTARPTAVQRAPESLRPRAVSNPQADFFKMFVQNSETELAKQRRKMKLRRFIACEAAALAVLLPLAILGLSRPPDNAALVWIMNILAIASAVSAALIPILFFAFTPTLPEIER